MVRSDALENRRRILDAARRTLGADPAASMNQVAQRAGVGAGTLYRNFPNREALVLAVYADEVDRIVDAVPGLLVEHPPLAALRAWTVDLVAAMRAKHGLGDALGAEAHQAVADQSRGPVVGAITTLLEAGRADGTIRGDVDPGDYLQLTGALWRAPVDRSEAILDLVLDGLRPR